MHIFWRIIAALLLMSAASPQDIDEVALQQLGLLLGLPVNKNAVFMRQEDFPSFMNNVYSCWKSNPADDCLPGYHGKDVNLLRTFLGSGTF